jgi:hypothetical protein
MPLPHEQLAEFRKGLAEHERRVAQLREGIRLAREEIEFHQLLLGFAQNERTIAALHELHDRHDLLAELVQDPTDYCQARGIPVPQGVTLVPTAGGVAVDLQYGAWSMRVGWNLQTGLFADTPRGPAASLSSRFMSSVNAEHGSPG